MTIPAPLGIPILMHVEASGLASSPVLKICSLCFKYKGSEQKREMLLLIVWVNTPDTSLLSTESFMPAGSSSAGNILVI